MELSRSHHRNIEDRLLSPSPPGERAAPRSASLRQKTREGEPGNVRANVRRIDCGRPHRYLSKSNSTHKTTRIPGSPNSFLELATHPQRAVAPCQVGNQA